MANGIVVDAKLTGIKTAWDKQAEVVKVTMTFEAEYMRDLMKLLGRTGARLIVTVQDYQDVLPGFERQVDDAEVETEEAAVG